MNFNTYIDSVATIAVRIQNHPKNLLYATHTIFLPNPSVQISSVAQPCPNTPPQISLLVFTEDIWLYIMKK